MNKYVYVDNSNVWIEGTLAVAVEQNLAFDVRDARERNVAVANWRYDFGKLLAIAGDGPGELKKVVLFGSRPPQADSLWKMAEQCGCDVSVVHRARDEDGKRSDTSVVAAMMRDAMVAIQNQEAEETELVLVAGDGDYVPAVKVFAEFGFKVTVCFWDHADRKLKEAASEFVSLNPYVDQLSRRLKAG